MEWTDELINRLQVLWQQGLSTAEIGRQLSITKNAVVGKAHRLGLAPRPSPIRAGQADAKKGDLSAQEGGQGTARKASKPADAPSKEAKDAPEPKGRAKSAKKEPLVAEKKDKTPSLAKEDAPPSPVRAARKDSKRSAGTPSPMPIVEEASKLERENNSKASKGVGANASESDKLVNAEIRPLLRPLTADLTTRRGPSCCWPFGDPGTPEFHFCGAKPVAGKPYCAEHCAIAYVKLRDRRDPPPSS